MKHTVWWPFAITASNIAVVLLVSGDVSSTARILVSFWFLLVCPGMAFVRLINFGSVAAEWVAAIALSLVIDTIVAHIMFQLGLWSTEAALIVLVIITGVGVSLHGIKWLSQALKMGKVAWHRQ